MEGGWRGRGGGKFFEFGLPQQQKAVPPIGLTIGLPFANKDTSLITPDTLLK